MSYLQCGRSGNVDKYHSNKVDETGRSTNVIPTEVNDSETSTNVTLAMWTKRERRQMSYLQCERSGNVDKCQTYNVDERKRWQMSCLQCGRTETLTNVKLTMWTKRKRWQMSYLPTWTKQKRRQMAYLQCERNGNVDKCHTEIVDETETLTNHILTDVNETETSTNVKLKMWTKQKRRRMSNLQCGRNGNVNKCHT